MSLTVLLVILLVCFGVGIVGFIGGVVYDRHHRDQVERDIVHSHVLGAGLAALKATVTHAGAEVMAATKSVSTHAAPAAAAVPPQRASVAPTTTAPAASTPPASA